jgi:hypothetical protein
MPPYLAPHFSVGAMAVMRIIADEYRDNGLCHLSKDAIAARAGVCRKTVRRAIALACTEGLISIMERPVPGRKHLPNLVRVTSSEWLSWINRGARITPGSAAKNTPSEEAILRPSIGGHLCPTTDIRLEDDGGGGGDASTKTCSPAEALQEEVAEKEPSDEATAEDKPDNQAEGLRLKDKPGDEAIAFARELASIAGHRRNALPQAWIDARPEWVVQTWLNTGVPVSDLRSVTAAAMRKKPDRRAPYSPRYFSHEVRRMAELIQQIPEVHFPNCGGASTAARIGVKRPHAGGGRQAKLLGTPRVAR